MDLQFTQHKFYKFPYKHMQEQIKINGGKEWFTKEEIKEYIKNNK